MPPKIRLLLAIVSLAEWLIWPVANGQGSRVKERVNLSNITRNITGPAFPVGEYGYQASIVSILSFTGKGANQHNSEDISVQFDGTVLTEMSQIKVELVSSETFEDVAVSGRSKVAKIWFRADEGGEHDVTLVDTMTINRGAPTYDMFQGGWSRVSNISLPPAFNLPEFYPYQGETWPLTAPDVDPATPQGLAPPYVVPLTPAAPAVPGAVPIAPATAPLPTTAPPWRPATKPKASPAATTGTKTPPIPATAAPMQPNGRPALPPAPALVKTPTGTTFLPGGVPLPNNGPRPTPAGTASELGKLEKKLELALAPEGPLSLLDKINRVIDQIENIEYVLDSLFPPEPYTYGAGEYALTPVCERDQNNNPLPDRVADWQGGTGEIVEVNAKLDALAQLIQFHKELKQPTCRGPAPTGEGVTVTFEEIPGA